MRRSNRTRGSKVENEAPEPQSEPLRGRPAEGDARPGEATFPLPDPAVEAGSEPEPSVDAAPADAAPADAARADAAPSDAEQPPRPAERPDPSGVTVVAGALRAIDRGPRAADETTVAPEEPTVRIGRIDVVVQAPASPPAAPTDQAPGDVLSRTYLRSL